MFELYHFNNSVCSQKVRMTLFEKDLEWKGHDVNLFASQQYDPEYLKLNPKGVVPTLVHDGKPVIESTLICEYLDDIHPEPALRPTDPAALAEMRLWGKTVDDGLHVGVTMFSFSAMFRDRLKNMSDEDKHKRFRNVGSPERRDRSMSNLEEGIESPYVMWAIAAYESAIKGMDHSLSDGRSWLAGDMYSLAEVNLTPYFARLENLDFLDVWTGGRPRVQEWWVRTKARPSYEAEINGPLTDEMRDEMRVSGGKIKDRVRARREEYLSQF